eukprot:CAMPEP_0201725016 /NCGR_PEP_ID=MMETSP0593-20130828/8548_1 /ASSEMBLY_ACC=CAM_ASM_000672 /TAXON_ID=267983 /ORGANISM="Skeletonema japonicum, Strain CCMP2506" /LENGTH=106 /DNA_ID=CAMNT_0048216331 /DNA_START=82 /DNA_END=399 /DNA_ORIENTATION=+
MNPRLQMFSTISLFLLCMATAQSEDFEQGQGRSLRGVSKPDSGNLFVDERAKPGSGETAVGLLGDQLLCNCDNGQHDCTNFYIPNDCSTCCWHWDQYPDGNDDWVW